MNFTPVLSFLSLKITLLLLLLFFLWSLSMKVLLSYAAREDSWSGSWVWEAARRISRENSYGRITQTRTRQNGWARCCDSHRALIWSAFKRYVIFISIFPRKCKCKHVMYSRLLCLLPVYSTLLFTRSFCSCFYWINPVCFATAIWYKCCFLFLFYRFQKCRSTIRHGQHICRNLKPLG